MYNKPKSRLTLTKETNSTLSSLQILPALSSKHLTSGAGYNQQIVEKSVQPQEQVIFRPTQIPNNNDIMMKRYPQGPPDFTLNHIAEKIPIHYRANKRPMVPAPACAHDYSTPDIVQDAEESGRNSRSSANLSPKTQKAPAFLPEDYFEFSGDRVIFAESPSAPGIPVVYRTPEERSSNPDRLNLDRRKLSVCPILEGEDQLRLLNYQHNMITKIQHLSTLKRLIFLDLYDNQIEEISGLSSLKSLRVLMLGKNRIKKIENLDTLTKLDVLDLHGNQISLIENLNHLAELRVLNLAGNQISNVDNLSGMDSLAELNLRRNRIRTVLDVDNLPSLQRLFLSFNDICSFEDISSLSDSASLSEISLDGNPITQEQYYKQIVLRHMQQLKQLDMKRVTEEERRIALVMARKEEEKKRESNKTNIMKEKKRLAINNARRQWEVNQSTMINRTGKLIKMPELYANHVGSVANSDIISPSNEENLEVESIQSESKQSSRGGSRPSSAQSGGEETRPRTGNKVQQFKSESQRPGQLKETVIFGNQGQYASDLNNLADLEGDSLTMYGPQSLEALDRNWGVQAAGAVTHVLFKFIDFVDIAKHLHKIRTRFPGVQTITFSSTNIRSLVQINALSAVRRLDNLNIDLDGNPITKFTLWRMFVIFRLAHFALKKINDVEISAADIVNAEKLFGPVSHITTSQLPQSRLLSLIGETRRKQLLAMSEDKSKKILEGKLDKSQGEFVGRSGLTYQSKESVASKSQDSSNKRQFAKTYISEITKETVFTDKKRNEFLKQWPLIFHEMVYSAVTDMSDMQGYMKRCLEELEKS
uniref:Leucine-rich repeat-containing protein 49-like isoform X3 n=1 Tax=Crassostrea virginica TaxID=6565 RepID=A0A8B8DQS8_CRAVI|nr:leucine-rich repeat-containing protein 49-like isoform X3 [Crassostrea virginica]